jgi:hypothetical protein
MKKNFGGANAQKSFIEMQSTQRRDGGRFSGNGVCNDGG